jgi:hypothetical protein
MDFEKDTTKGGLVYGLRRCKQTIYAAAKEQQD